MLRKALGAAVTTFLVAAALGLAGWFVFAALTDATLITFRTGSMSPTMPQGAVAVTVPVTADELRVGDVVTVQRSGERLPVTHRIIAIGQVEPQVDNAADIRAAAPGAGAPDLTSPQARQITMQGDDNKVPDPLPYALTSANRVILSVPRVGHWLMLAQSPIGLGVLIVGTGALVTWAFWPRQSQGTNAQGLAAYERRHVARVES